MNFSEIHGENALYIKTCQYWFRCLSSDGFDTVYQERDCQTRNLEDEELKVHSQMKQSLSIVVGVLPHLQNAPNFTPLDYQLF